MDNKIIGILLIGVFVFGFSIGYIYSSSFYQNKIWDLQEYNSWLDEQVQLWIDRAIEQQDRVLKLQDILEINIDDSFYKKRFVNECFYGITAFDSIFDNCTIHNSTVYHCHFIDSNVTNTFVYASLFEYKYGVRYVDCSDGRQTYNVTSWWETP